MSHDEKTIRFIDSHYNTLFTLPNGGKIVLTDRDGFRKTRTCSFIDPTHVGIAGNAYHICQFAEMMERNGTQYAPELPVTLPDMCYSQLPSTGELVVLKKDEIGYFPCFLSSDNPTYNAKQVKHLNESLQVTPHQCAAMEAGSMFGFSVLAADPNRYDVHGKPLPPSDPSKEVTYAIYQLRDVPELRTLRFVPLRELARGVDAVRAENYACVYQETLRPTEPSSEQSLLDTLYYRFNVEHPKDFIGHSLSISDVVIISRDGMKSAYYVDSVGFHELINFQLPENPLKNTEMDLEDGYGMIDGVINSGLKSTSTKPERQPSFMEKLQTNKQIRPSKAKPQELSQDLER